MTYNAKIGWMAVVLVALCVGLSFFRTARAGELFLDINGISKHSQSTYWYQGQEIPFNSENPGIGITYKARPHLDLKSGFYKNSYYRTSAYAAINISKEFRIEKVGVTPGVMFGVATGYTDTPMYSHVLQPSVFLTVGIKLSGTGFNIGYIPGLTKLANGNPVSAIIIQFTTQI